MKEQNSYWLLGSGVGLVIISPASSLSYLNSVARATYFHRHLYNRRCQVYSFLLLSLERCRSWLREKPVIRLPTLAGGS